MHPGSPQRTPDPRRAAAPVDDAGPAPTEPRRAGARRAVDTDSTPPASSSAARRAAPGPRRGTEETPAPEPRVPGVVTLLRPRHAVDATPPRPTSGEVPRTPRRAATGPATPVEDILRAAASRALPDDTPVARPRHAAASDEALVGDSRTPARHAAERVSVLASDAPSSDLGSASPSGPRPGVLPRPQTPRVRLAYQFGVPVVGVAMLLAVQAFTPAPTSASSADLAMTGPVTSSSPATGSGAAGSGSASIPGLNADGSLSVTAPRARVSASITSRAGGRPTLTGLAGPEQLGSGSCPVGGTAHVSCNQAIEYMVSQMSSQTTVWHNQCLALVGAAYGGIFRYVPRAIDAAMMVKASGKLHTTTDYSSIPRGSLLWFASAPDQYNQAGHVAIAVGGGMAISNDVLHDDGRVGVVPISFFTTQWGKIFLGYSSPADASGR